MIYFFLFFLILSFLALTVQGFIVFLMFKEMGKITVSMQKIETIELARGLQIQALRDLPNKIEKTQVRAYTDEELHDLEKQELEKELLYGEENEW